MYREPGVRPSQPNENASRPTARVEIARVAGLTPVLGIMCVVAAGFAYTFLGSLLAAAFAFLMWAIFAVVVTQFLLRPSVVEVDFAARRIRSPSHDCSFDELTHAKVNVDESVAELTLMARAGEQIVLAKGMPASVNAAADEINLALGAEYESIRMMPDGLAHAMKRLPHGFPLAHAVDGSEARERIEALLRDLPLVNLEVREMRDAELGWTATSRGIPISFFYRWLKDRIEVAATVRSPHGHIELRRREGLREVANGWMPSSESTPEVLVNGDTNRRAFSSLPSSLRERIGSELMRQRLRSLNLYPEETRAVSRDGLRDLRDPRARLAWMLELVVEIGEAVSR